MRDRADQQYPPYGRLILIRLSGLEAKITEHTAENLAERLQKQLTENRPSASQSSEDPLPYRIMGPVPAPIFRIAQRYRWHILIKLSLDAPLPALKHLQDRCPQGVSLTIDVEPLNLS